jgi:hypothetical protein
MHAVLQTSTFRRDADDAGMTEAEIDALVDLIAANPMAGVEIPGTGGCRKLRLAGKGKGKSGGYRVITFYSGVDIPVFLVSLYAKSAKANLSKAERNVLREFTAVAVENYRRR